VPKRWRDDEPFVEALLRREYLTRRPDGNLQLCMAEGQYLYMWELWQDALYFCDCCEHGKESGCCLDCCLDY
jgi:hypothetical protein